MADYFLDVVNKKDEVIGKELKSKKQELGFVSRVVAVYLRDPEGKFWMCKRADHKDDAPAVWDLAACGNVESGEAYDEAMPRELREELGISCELKKLGKYYLEVEAAKGGALKYFCSIYTGVSDELPDLNHELVECKKMSFDEIESELAAHPEKFCHGFRVDWENVREKLRVI